jgi:hypothetical protein
VILFLRGCEIDGNKVNRKGDVVSDSCFASRTCAKRGMMHDDREYEDLGSKTVKACVSVESTESVFGRDTQPECQVESNDGMPVDLL